MLKVCIILLGKKIKIILCFQNNIFKYTFNLYKFLIEAALMSEKYIFSEPLAYLNSYVK